MASCDLARPVIGEAHALQLRTHCRDVLICPDRRVDIFGNRCVFGRQAERIPAHRMQHVKALRTAIAGDKIPHRIIADMPDMQLARRIGKHFKHIVFRRARLGRDFEHPPLAPYPLPFGFGFSEIVTRYHRGRSFIVVLPRQR